MQIWNRFVQKTEIVRIQRDTQRSQSLVFSDTDMTDMTHSLQFTLDHFTGINLVWNKNKRRDHESTHELLTLDHEMMKLQNLISTWLGLNRGSKTVNIGY